MLYKKKASGFLFERRRDGVTELSRLRGSEGYAVRADEGAYWFRRGCGDWNSGRMRLSSLKWATYKLKNNDNVELVAA